MLVDDDRKKVRVVCVVRMRCAVGIMIIGVWFRVCEW